MNLWVVVADTSEVEDIIEIHLFGVYTESRRAHYVARQLNKKYRYARIISCPVNEDTQIFLGGTIR